MAPPGRRHQRGGRLRRGGLAAAIAVLAAGCQPGITWSVAGTGSSGTSGDAGPATAATLSAPGPVTAAPDGGFYVADTSTCVIRRVDATGIIATVAGTAGTCGHTGDGGPAVGAEITPVPHGNLGLDAAGDLFFLDTDSIRKVASDGTISTVAPALNTSGMAVAADGTVYQLIDQVGGTPAVTVKAIAPGGSTTTVYAGPGLPAGLALAGPGTLVTRIWNPLTPGAGAMSLSRISIATGTVSTTGVTATALGFGGDFTSFATQPLNAAPDGTIYTVDATHHVVRVDTGGTVSVIAGNGASDPGTSAQVGLGTSLALTPAGLAATPHNGLLLSSGHVVYRLADPEHAG